MDWYYNMDIVCTYLTRLTITKEVFMKPGETPDEFLARMKARRDQDIKEQEKIEKAMDQNWKEYQIWYKKFDALLDHVNNKGDPNYPHPDEEHQNRQEAAGKHHELEPSNKCCCIIF